MLAMDYLDEPTKPSTRVAPPPEQAPRPRRTSCGAVIAAAVIGLAVGSLLASVALAAVSARPLNVLVLGVDHAPGNTFGGRSDTMVLLHSNPYEPYLGLLSVPRDLWIEIPGKGENRINTAHYFGELAQPGSGGLAAVQTVEHNFGIPLDGYFRISFAGLAAVVDSLGGVPIELPERAGRLDPGSYMMDGDLALSFLRDRTGSDDFTRMSHGRMFISALVRRVLSPLAWPRLPFFLWTVKREMDTNLTLPEMLDLAVAAVKVGQSGIDARGITWDAVEPFMTSDGAAVLAPNWTEINALVAEMFLR